MGYRKILEDLENEAYKIAEERQNWTSEKKEEIEAKEQEITKRVKEKLDENNIRITNIFSFLLENKVLRDGTTKKAVFLTRFRDSTLNKTKTVVSDFKTLEMLYVQTDVTRFMDINKYFVVRQ